jgi:hypothetical protein
LKDKFVWLGFEEFQTYTQIIDIFFEEIIILPISDFIQLHSINKGCLFLFVNIELITEINDGLTGGK